MEHKDLDRQICDTQYSMGSMDSSIWKDFCVTQRELEQQIVGEFEIENIINHNDRKRAASHHVKFKNNKYSNSNGPRNLKL